MSGIQGTYTNTLRETVESLFILWRTTHDDIYRSLIPFCLTITYMPPLPLSVSSTCFNHNLPFSRFRTWYRFNAFQAVGLGDFSSHQIFGKGLHIPA